MAESTENVDENEDLSGDGDEVDLDELQKVFDEIQDELVSAQEETLRHYEICFLISSTLTNEKVLKTSQIWHGHEIEWIYIYFITNTRQSWA